MSSQAHPHTLAQQRIYVHACVRTHVHTWNFAQNGQHTGDFSARALCERCVSPAKPTQQVACANCLCELLARALARGGCASPWREQAPLRELLAPELARGMIYLYDAELPYVYM